MVMEKRWCRLPLFIFILETESIKPRSSYTESSSTLRNILLGNNILEWSIVTARDLSRLKKDSGLKILPKARR